MRFQRGQASYKRFEKANRPPPQQPWAWITCEMLESPAWGALTAPVKRVIERILIEHMHHAGTENGNLVVTFDDFEAFGVTRRAIKSAIQIAVRLGFIDVTFQGVRSHGSARRPSRYAITWLPRCDGTLVANRWKSISTKEQAEAAVAAVYSLKKNSSRSGPRRASSLTPTQDIKSSVLNATGAKSSKSVIPR